jgi:hypothetical protein
MTPGELLLLLAVSDRRKVIVEFGCGGSTKQWLAQERERVFSVESDEAWISVVRQDEQIGAALKAGSLELIHADVGPVGSWGRPTDRHTMPSWPLYWSGVWTRHEARNADFVFVDGRFRVACALNASLHVDGDALIAIHDFWGREQYRVILEHLSLVATHEKLAVFRRPEGLDVAGVVDAIAVHALDTR